MEYVRIPCMVLVLASNSPRRRQILNLGGWDFIVQPAEVDEQLLPGEDSRQYVLRLAECKARAVAQGASVGAYVIAADTTVVDWNGDHNQPARVLAKPADADEAASMLHQLGGRTHQVLTGLVVLNVADGRLERELVSTDVVMRAYSEAEIKAYVATGDPLDKAGAYAIQHAGFHPVERLDGCYANVVGLPLCVLALMLEKFGITSQSEVVRQCRAAAPGEACAVEPLVLDG